MAPAKWVIDVGRSSVGFTVRHMLVSKVHGRFTAWRGEFTLDEATLPSSSALVEVDVASVDTGDASRDEYLRTGEAFEPSKFPRMTFRSTSVSGSAKRFEIVGDLTLRGVTKAVALEVESKGRVAGTGGEGVRFSARGQLNRRDFGVNFNQVLDAGGVAVSEKVELEIEVIGTRATPAP
jgi:polyisoprenoid-binding protein YceI